MILIIFKWNQTSNKTDADFLSFLLHPWNQGEFYVPPLDVTSDSPQILK